MQAARLKEQLAQAQLQALREELATTERYLEIQRTRFSGRLAVRLDIDPEALGAKVPSLVLQPLVENAFRHVVILKDGTQLKLSRGRREQSGDLARAPVLTYYPSQIRIER